MGPFLYLVLETIARLHSRGIDTTAVGTLPPIDGLGYLEISYFGPVIPILCSPVVVPIQIT